MQVAAETVVHLQSVHKRFGALHVLRGVSFSVTKGQVVAIIGKSGSGKSTALRCINRLESVDEGQIRVCGHQVHDAGLDKRALRRDVGIVFPSLIIISALAGVINTFSHLAWVQHAFAGIRVCVCVLIFNAVVKLFKSAVKDWPAGVIFAVVLALSLLTDLSPVVFVALAAAAGIVVQNLIRRNG